jgi:hypothetical protein
MSAPEWIPFSCDFCKDESLSPSTAGLDSSALLWLALSTLKESDEGPTGIVGRGPVIDVRLNAASEPWTDSITCFNFERDRLTLLIFRDGQREIPCCLQMRFMVVGHTVKQEKY